MKIERTVIYLILLLLVSSCVSDVVTIRLQDNYMVGLHDKTQSASTVEEETGIPALKMKNGNIKEAGYWWSGNTKHLEITSGNELIIQCTEVGPNYVPFGSDLAVTDFVKSPVAIKVTAKAENGENETPILALQLDDVEGYQTNATRPSKRIDVTPEFKDYYFDCRNIWLQSWPYNHKVDGRIINKILFFINPGGRSYTGKIIIKEIQVVPIDSIKSTPMVKAKIGNEFIGVLQDFSGDISNWGGGEKFLISKTSDSALKITVDKVGPKYESFSVKLSTLNMREANKVKLRIRVESKESLEFRLDCKDIDGYITNASPASVILNPKDSSYKYVFFDYKNKWKQSWPDNKTVDKERIVEFVVFINPGKNPWSGNIYIDDIEIIKPNNSENKVEQIDMTR